MEAIVERGESAGAAGAAEAAQGAGGADPFGFELFRNTIFAIADEMALTVCRTTYSGVLRDNMDFSTALTDGDGRLIAQGLTLPGHLGSVPTAIESVLRHYGDDIHPGDVYVMNDPFDGGMHLPDIFIFKPVFDGGERLAFAATVCHHADVGGRVAGSNASDSTEIYQEGVRIPPLRLYDKGKRNETLFAILEKNVRLPVKLFGDLRAQLAACHIAERQFIELVQPARRPGHALLPAGDHRLCRAPDPRRAPRPARRRDQLRGLDRRRRRRSRQADQAVRDAPQGGRQPPRGLVRLLAASEGARSTARSPGPRPPPTRRYARSCQPGIPNNEGVFRAITVSAPSGTITNAVLPAACAARGLTGFRMVDCAFGALAMMLPDKVFAASDGGNTGITIGGYDDQRKPFIYVDFTCGTWGARPWADGLDGNSNIFANMASQSVEVTEAEYPLQILSYEFVPDRAGAGRYRGGTPFRRDYRFLEAEGLLQVRSDRHTFRPYGLYGGSPGQPSRNAMNPGPDERPLPSKLTETIQHGDVFRHELAGAGGWGDPLERDPAGRAARPA